jgi:uncharacterized membrane protein
MENTQKPLPGAGQLISDAWKLFTSTWNTSVQTSIFYLYVGLALFASALLVKFVPSLAILDGLINLAGGIFVFWITIRLYMTMLNLEAGKKPMDPADESKKAWSLFFPMFWVAILTGLATLAGFVLLIIPGIYLAIALGFSQIILIDRNARGTQALGASRALVKGRWWGTFWRMLAGGFVFGLLVGVVVGVLVGIATSIAGPEMTSSANADPVFVGATSLIMYAVQAALMPLMFGFTVKVYRALEKTR